MKTVATLKLSAYYDFKIKELDNRYFLYHITNSILLKNGFSSLQEAVTSACQMARILHSVKD